MTATSCAIDHDYHASVQSLASGHPDLARDLASFRGLEDLLNWMQAREFPPGSVDMIGQDEFCYDFLLELKTNGRWLVFGVT